MSSSAHSRFSPIPFSPDNSGQFRLRPHLGGGDGADRRDPAGGHAAHGLHQFGRAERAVPTRHRRACAGADIAFPGVDDGKDFQCPRGRDVVLTTSLQLDAADPLETAEREYADDQALHIGYAVATPETRHLPLEQHLAMALRQRLLELCVLRRELGAGPDGKLVVVLVPAGASSSAMAVTEVIVSLQHLDRAPLVLLQRAARSLVLDELRAQHAAMPWLLAEPAEALAIRFNASVVFVRGGPMNDNGQTGRKLVCDFYGPRVPIGGGALSGKDPWRLDRVGAFRARQMALAIVETGFVRDALVSFTWGRRDRRPSHVGILVEGRELCAADVARWTRRYDPALRATWEELALWSVNYENCARAGHFGRDVPWERT